MRSAGTGGCRLGDEGQRMEMSSMGAGGGGDLEAGDDEGSISRPHVEHEAERAVVHALFLVRRAQSVVRRGLQPLLLLIAEHLDACGCVPGSVQNLSAVRRNHFPESPAHQGPGCFGFLLHRSGSSNARDQGGWSLLLDCCLPQAFQCNVAAWLGPGYSIEAAGSPSFIKCASPSFPPRSRSKGPARPRAPGPAKAGAFCTRRCAEWDSLRLPVQAKVRTTSRAPVHCILADRMVSSCR